MARDERLVIGFVTVPRVQHRRGATGSAHQVEGPQGRDLVVALGGRDADPKAAASRIAAEPCHLVLDFPPANRHRSG